MRMVAFATAICMMMFTKTTSAMRGYFYSRHASFSALTALRGERRQKPRAAAILWPSCQASALFCFRQKRAVAAAPHLDLDATVCRPDSPSGGI